MADYRHVRLACLVRSCGVSPVTILEHILQMKLGVLDGAFDGWTDERTVGRELVS